MGFFGSLFGDKEKEKDPLKEIKPVEKQSAFPPIGQSLTAMLPKTSPKTEGSQSQKVDEEDWILDFLAQNMRSRAWKNEVAIFLNEHCHVFEDSAESSEDRAQKQAEVHKQYVKLIESKIDAVLLEVEIGHDQFLEHFKKGMSIPRYQVMTRYITGIDNFTPFREGMTQRFRNITQNALHFADGEYFFEPPETQQEANELLKAIEMSRLSYQAHLDLIEQEEAALRAALKASEESYTRELARLNGNEADLDPSGSHLSQEKRDQMKREKMEKAKDEMEKNKADLERRLRDLAELRQIHHNNFLQEQEKQHTTEEFWDTEHQDGERLEERKKRLTIQRDQIFQLKKERKEAEEKSAKKLASISAKENQEITREEEQEILKNRQIYSSLKRNSKI